METIYVLHGSSGRFDDHTSWQVAAYRTQSEADWHKAALDELQQTPGSAVRLQELLRSSGLDDRATVVDDEVRYSIEPLTLRDKAPRPPYAVEVEPGRRSRDSALAERSGR